MDTILGSPQRQQSPVRTIASLLLFGYNHGSEPIQTMSPTYDESGFIGRDKLFISTETRAHHLYQDPEVIMHSVALRNVLDSLKVWQGYLLSNSTSHIDN